MHLNGVANFVEGIYLESSLEKGCADGIDIDGCKDVVISNCIVTAGDDATVLSQLTQWSYNLVKCNGIQLYVRVYINSFKLGTESYGDFRHIKFNNCT